MPEVILYSRKVWQGKSLADLLVLNIWQKKVWQMNRFSQKAIIVTRNLDGFSLANQMMIHQICQTLSPPNFLAMGYYNFILHTAVMEWDTFLCYICCH